MRRGVASRGVFCMDQGVSRRTPGGSCAIFRNPFSPCMVAVMKPYTRMSRLSILRPSLPHLSSGELLLDNPN